MFENNNFICIKYLKMIKFNKSTHLMILFTFAIIFVVLYLYYTINDVKRMSNELKKITSDVQKINLDIQGLNGALNNLNLATNNLIIQKQPQQISSVVVKPVNSQSSGAKNDSSCQKQSPSALINDLEDDDEDDDATSVNTEELKNIINENDDVEEETSEVEKKKESVIPIDDVSDDDESDDNDDLELEATSALLKSVATPIETIDFHKLKYEELKDLCKKNGISTKGTKDQLISKLQAS